MEPPQVPAYLRRARRRFLAGIPYRAPVDAVLAGQRTLEQWAAILNDERWLAFAGRAEPRDGSVKRAARGPRKSK